MCVRVVWCGVVRYSVAVHCSKSQCVAVRCSALQCGAVRCSAYGVVCCSELQCGSALQCVVVRCSTLQYVAVSCSVLQCGTHNFFLRRAASDSTTRPCPTALIASCNTFGDSNICACALQCVAACCSMLQCVLVCFSVLQCVAVCFSRSEEHTSELQSR